VNHGIVVAFFADVVLFRKQWRIKFHFSRAGVAFVFFWLVWEAVGGHDGNAHETVTSTLVLPSNLALAIGITVLSYS
jgi:hypothetical protein